MFCFQPYCSPVIFWESHQSVSVNSERFKNGGSKCWSVVFFTPTPHPISNTKVNIAHFELCIFLVNRLKIIGNLYLKSIVCSNIVFLSELSAPLVRRKRACSSAYYQTARSSYGRCSFCCGGDKYCFDRDTRFTYEAYWHGNTETCTINPCGGRWQDCSHESAAWFRRHCT